MVAHGNFLAHIRIVHESSYFIGSDTVGSIRKQVTYRTYGVRNYKEIFSRFIIIAMDRQPMSSKGSWFQLFDTIDDRDVIPNQSANPVSSIGGLALRVAIEKKIWDCQRFGGVVEGYASSRKSHP